MLLKTLLIVAFGASFAATAQAQALARRHPYEDSSAARTFVRYGAAGSVRLLRGELQSQAKRNELADSLVAMAARPVGARSAVETYGSSVDAISALQEAGQGFPANGDTPYDGAFDRLVRISREAPMKETRQVALSSLLLIAPHTRSIEYLRNLAFAQDSLAGFAMLVLAKEADSVGRSSIGTPAERRQTIAMLHDLWKQNPPMEKATKLFLDQLAYREGWLSSGPPPSTAPRSPRAPRPPGATPPPGQSGGPPPE